ncbi:MAG: helix-turn-helix domain-containing protein [Proteobacteria bacterium]|nr:helix-turn-helix domain-containing protein [Pseudomonadota bacterium]
MPDRKSKTTGTLPSPIPRRRLGVSPCAACDVRDSALCAALSPIERMRFSEGVTILTVPAASPLIDEGEPDLYVFNVVEGCLKVYKLLSDGRRQITGFLFPGDFLGLVNSADYTCSAEAVTETRLCRISRKQFDAFFDTMPSLERRLYTFASERIAEVQEHMLLLGRKTAAERLATFLSILSRRAAEAGRPADVIVLPMSRDDIADYLGLTTETVSRTFSKLRKAKLISIDKDRKIRLLDLEKISEIAAGS